MQTTDIGYVNKHKQEVINCTEEPGTDFGQKVYVLRCSGCGFEYGANGSDIWERKCPNCQGGALGIPFVSRRSKVQYEYRVSLTQSMRKEYSNIQALISNELLKGEHAPTRALITTLRKVKKRGYFTKVEFIEMCRWKSARPLRHYTSNSEERIRLVSKKVFATQFEKRRIELLTSLRGVSVPVASAILMLTDPKNYGVIDIRVWQLLYLYGSVKTKPTGKNFSVANWYTYLMKIRYFARRFKSTARQIERTLFEYHKTIQEGNLYT
jgi:hypothetical protein